MSETPDFLNMSDEDFLKASPASGGYTPDPVEKVVPETTEEVVDAEATPQAEEPVVTTPEKPKTAPDPHVNPKKAPAKPEANVEQTSDATETTDDDEQQEEDATEVSTETPGTDYESFYKQIMTPFKANGRTIELKTPEEAIQLMQMGANFTKKMQELAPQRKLLTMLQTNGLDEGKLSYLIDLDKKNPEAIKKLIKDAGIDPMEIDTSVEPAYHEGNHRVSDESVNFNATLEDLQSSKEGAETIQVINGDWDQVSKEALWTNPEIMTLIHEQRNNGVYARIQAEVDRRKILGKIRANIPFLQAYKLVGEEMTRANAFDDLGTQAPAVKAPVIVATRVAAPKAAVKNSDRAAAASTNRSSSAVKEAAKNPLSMSDEDFLKLDQFAGRV